MLVLEVIHCPDQLIFGDIFFYFSRLRIGRSPKCHLVINDSKVKSIDLILSMHQEGVLIENVKSSFYLSNSKKVTGKKYHNLNDTFQLGDTLLKIKAYSFESIQSPLDYEKAYQNFISNNPDKISLLDSLELELQQLKSL